MKRVKIWTLTLLTATGALGVGAATAAAATSWPATCTTMRCVNAHLNNEHDRRVARDASLDARIDALEARVAALETGETGLVERVADLELDAAIQATVLDDVTRQLDGFESAGVGASLVSRVAFLETTQTDIEQHVTLLEDGMDAWGSCLQETRFDTLTGTPADPDNWLIWDSCGTGVFPRP
jgi:uncharacterized coiled-coil protein SlyX